MVFLREGLLLRFDVSIISKNSLFEKLYFRNNKKTPSKVRGIKYFQSFQREFFIILIAYSQS